MDWIMVQYHAHMAKQHRSFAKFWRDHGYVWDTRRNESIARKHEQKLQDYATSLELA